MKYSKKQLLIMISTTFVFGLGLGFAKISHAEILAPKTLKNFLIEFATSDDEKSKCSENDLAVCSVIAPWFLQQSADFQKEVIADPAAILDVANLPAAVGDAVRTRLANGPIVGSAFLGAPGGTNSFAIGSDGRPIIPGGVGGSGFAWGQLIGQTTSSSTGSAGTAPALGPASTPNWHYSAEESDTGSTGVSPSGGSASQPSNNSGTWVSDGTTSSAPASDGGITLPEPEGQRITSDNPVQVRLKSSSSDGIRIFNDSTSLAVALHETLFGIANDQVTAVRQTEETLKWIQDNLSKDSRDFTVIFGGVENGTVVISLGSGVGWDEDANSVRPVISAQEKAAIVQGLQNGVANRPLPKWWDPSENSSKNGNSYILDPVVKHSPTVAAQRQISTNSGRAQLRFGNVGAGPNGNNPTGESPRISSSGPAVQGCGGPGKPVCSGL